MKCHGEEKQKSGLRLDQRPLMLKGGDSGLPAVVPKKPEKSFLLEVVSDPDHEIAMPPKGRSSHQRAHHDSKQLDHGRRRLARPDGQEA